jgi:uncharacterized protein YceH (UPF0502 family)
MAIELTAIETRVFGCLLEKERVTPENYPLSLHSLTAACNQSTNREPVVSYDEKMVEAALDGLRGKKLATMIWAAGARVQKFRHNLSDFYNLNPGEQALLCVLLLRGPQTAGELRARTERMHGFGSVPEVEESLHGLSQGSDPLVRVLPPRPGQKEQRWVQLLSGEPEIEESSSSAPLDQVPREPSRVERLEAEINAMKTELAALREEFANFKKQFE